jgi:CheY-like chemotaxis protein/nitrogen-specific signal transduction histidine kinase
MPLMTAGDTRPVILAVDDNEATRYAIARILRHQGFEVLEAATGTEGLRLASQLPDLVLLDIRLPDVDGFEVCRRLRADPQTQAIPILHISASYTDSHHRTQALEGGADGYLTHPVEPSELVATVRALLRARRAEAGLQRAVREWRTTFDAIGERVCLVDLQGRIIRCNRSFASLLEAGFDAILARPLTDLLPALESVAPDGATHSDPALAPHEIVLQGRAHRVTAEWVKDLDGTVVGLVWVLADTQDQKDAEEAIRQTQKLESIGVLAGGIAHDFNNLLTGIIGNASLALRSVSGDARVRAGPMLSDVIRAGERAADLTRQLLAYAGKGRRVVEPVDVKAMLDETRNLLRLSVPRGIDLDIETPDRAVRVSADRGQLQQVVMNLVINAAEAVGEGPGRVTIRVDTADLAAGGASYVVRPGEGRYVRICVTDTGHGMDEETLHRIFEPFFTTKFLGRGLGLSAVQGIVTSHGGGLKVESRPGEGTTFTILIPELVTDVLTLAPRATPAEGGSARGAVLVVDDEPIVRAVARIALVEQGYEVLEAGNGKEAVSMVREHGARLGIVLLDVSMPVMGGEQAFGEIRVLRRALPIAVMSGHAEADVVERFPDPVDGFLAKPFRGDQVVDFVDRTIAASTPN